MTGKTFERGEVLTADDVNAYLNPETAPHLAKSVAAGTQSITIPAGSTYANAPTVTVNFPAGRFAAAPTVVATVRQALTAWPITAMVRTKTATSVTFQISWDSSYGLSNSVTVNIDWVAVEL